MKGEHSRLLSDEQLDDVAARYRRGETIRELSRAYGVSTAVVRNALLVRDVRRRDRNEAWANYVARKRPPAKATRCA